MRLFRRRGKPTWHARFYDADGNRVTRSTKCTDRGAAEKVGRRLERDAADPSNRTSQATLTQALSEFLRDARMRCEAGDIAAATLVFYERRVGHLLRMQSIDGPDGETVLPVKLARLGPRHFDWYIAQRRAEKTQSGEPISMNTIGKELVVLGSVLKLARRRQWWKGDVDALMPENFRPGYKPRERWLSKTDFVALCAELAPARAAQVAFIVATSARLSESIRARREDVTRERVFLRGTKTEKSERLVPLVAPWQVALVALALRDGDGADGLLFRPWMKIVRDLHLACGRAKIARCSPNDLRRTYAHWMKHEGVPDTLVAPAMGHTDSKMVRRVYGRLGADEVEAGLRAIIVREVPEEACTTGAPDEMDPTDTSDPSDIRTPLVLAPAAGLEPATRWLTGIGTRSETSTIHDVSARSEAAGSAGAPPALAALARAAKELGAAWDALERAATGDGEDDGAGT